MIFFLSALNPTAFRDPIVDVVVVVGVEDVGVEEAIMDELGIRSLSIVRICPS